MEKSYKHLEEKGQQWERSDQEEKDHLWSRIQESTEVKSEEHKRPLYRWGWDRPTQDGTGRAIRGRHQSLRVDSCEHTLKAGVLRDWGSFEDRCRSTLAATKPCGFTL